MHLVQDESGNPLPHSHENEEHTHTHTHTYEHSHPHTHEHGHEEEHNHSHEHCPDYEGGHSHEHCGACSANGNEPAQGDKMVALLDYMLKHNEHHAVELDQVAEKFREDGKEAAAEQIQKAVDEFQKGNLYLKLALSMVQEN